MTFEEAICTVPAQWTAFRLATRNRKTRFVFTMMKLDGDHQEEESETGHGSTPAEAVLRCVAKTTRRDIVDTTLKPKAEPPS